MVDKMVEYYWDGENWLKVYKINKFIEYYLGDKLHRNDGPAEIDCFDNNKIRLKKYWFNGKLHREGSPAFITYYWNGSVEFEFYYFNDILHRINGPSIIFYNNDGFIERKEYHIYGIEFDLLKLPFDLPIDTEEKRLYINLKYGG